MTRAELARIYGFDDTAIAAQLQNGRLEARVEEGLEQLRLTAVTTDKFMATVLHEVGHSVDSILGERTELVYGKAGWRWYYESDFDTWAGEMGGWDKVSPADRKAIRQAWMDALRSGMPVAQLVGKDHPARAEKYADVGIVATARAGGTFEHTERTQHGDRVFIMQPQYLNFYSVPASTAAVAPSEYSLFAPAEFFAECYVEYYRDVDGTAAGQKKKGGALAAWIKQYFDAKVDRIGFDPARLKNKDS